MIIHYSSCQTNVLELFDWQRGLLQTKESHFGAILYLFHTMISQKKANLICEFFSVIYFVSFIQE